MHKEPFIISLGNEDLPNLSAGEDNGFGFEFRQTNLWNEGNEDVVKLLISINEKLDKITGLMMESGKG